MLKFPPEFIAHDKTAVTESVTGDFVNMKQKGNIIPKYPEDIALRVRTSDSIENCIFEIAGKDHLFIRTQKGILPLKMSKNDYLRLFPPIKRFNIRQGPVGDCYYIAALDSLTKKAEGLSAIVDYFKISPEAISVKFPLSERVSFPKYREVMPFDILSFERLCAKESEWIKYMEAYYAEIKNRLPFANRKQKIKNIEGGFSDDVFRNLGLKSKKEWIYGVSSARDMIVNNIDHENCFLCASTKSFLDDSIKKAEMGLVNNHAYSLNKYDKYSDTFTVNNPHYSSVDIKLTMKEFCDNFGLIHFGKLL